MKRIALIAAAGLVLAGCSWIPASGPAPIRPPHYPIVVRSPVVEPVRPPVHVHGPAQIVSPTRLAIVTMGSSSCPSVPETLVVLGRHTIALYLTVGSWVNGGLVPKSPGVCTEDYGPTTMLVAIDPKLVDVHRRLTIHVFYPGSAKPEIWTAAPLGRYPVVIRLPEVFPIPRAQRGHLGIGGVKLVSPTRLGIVTVGSGSCPWIPEELTVLGPNTISIRMAEGAFRNGRAVIFHGSFGCTLDLRPTRMLLAIDPKLIDVHRPLTVVGIFVHGSKTPGVVTVPPLTS